MKRPVFWTALVLLSAAAALAAVRFFPRAFSIVALEITMDRERALAEARAVAAAHGLGPADYRQAASFSLDGQAQTFIELEGGGKDAFTRMLREGTYAAYTWRVRHFREGDVHEATLRFTPDGRAYGFVERLAEDLPGPALDGAAARRVADEGARRWTVDLSPFTLVEQGQERRIGGRVDHTLTYERATPTLNDGRYRLRLVVSGDRLTELTHFIQVPEAFTRRYEHMRSANDAIGIASAVSMMLLYVLGGIGVGLFFMLRRRWVVWRPAAIWGAAVGFLQALAMLNELPLLWMDYDTALPRSTFLAQHLALVTASFLGFSAFFGLSFMAAETLTRRAFGHHPQLWRAWSARPPAAGGDPPGASLAVLGRTIAGYLLVPVFLAFVVIFYYAANRYLGWWSPSEALLHPDVLSTYAPWLSAIANSLQAGFWEEALFRAVPLAGAALIGDRFGRRRLFLIIAFVIQALVFGGGHAQYPGQPAYARPVELILPSIGFGLLYLHFGLLPAVVLHFAFDVVLFALPIFFADAPGIRLQQSIVVGLLFAPLWLVLWRRVQAGRWTTLAAADRNEAWAPVAVPAAVAEEPAVPRTAIGRRAIGVWRRAGVVCGIALVAVGAAAVRQDGPALTRGRQEAAAIARDAILKTGATLDPPWRVMAAPDNGADAPHEFVFTTAGAARWTELRGRYLPLPRWHVRAATYEGDVADRAEEWTASVAADGSVRALRHRLPEARPAPSLDEAAARRLAAAAVAERLGLQSGQGHLAEISARPTRLAARTDWTFTFRDTTVEPLPEGELRVAVEIAGPEVAFVGRFIHVPEDWQRRGRAAETRNLIIRIAASIVLAGLLVGAAASGVMAWSRRAFHPRLFVAAAGFMLAASIARSANNWPAVAAALPTAAPLPLQILGLVGVGLVALAVTAVLVGLVLGAVPHRIAATGRLPTREAAGLAVAAGLFGSLVGAAASWVRTPAWARVPDVDAAGAVVPILQAALDPLPRVLMASAVLLPALLIADELTWGWSRRRAAGLLVLGMVGIAAAGLPVGLATGPWAAAGLLTAAALVTVHLTLLRFDPTMVPLALATMIAAGALLEGLQRAYAGALAGSAAGAVLAIMVGWWWFGLLRRSAAAAADAEGPRPLEEYAPNAAAIAE